MQNINNYFWNNKYHYFNSTEIEMIPTFKKSLIDKFYDLTPFEEYNTNYYRDHRKLSIPGLISEIVFEDKFVYIEKCTIHFMDRPNDRIFIFIHVTK